MLNKLEIYLQKQGDWHIGVSVNKQFQSYTSSDKLVIDLEPDCDNTIEIIFLGRDHSDPDTSDWVCTIENIYINQLQFPELVNHSHFVSDNNEYKHIDACNYINLNGVWQLTINTDTCSQLIKRYLNV